MAGSRLILPLLGCAAVFASAPARACDCRPPSSAAVGKAGVNLVFAGDVLSKEIIAVPAFGPAYKEFLVKFRVQKYWKGSPGRELTLRTFIDTAACGYPFENGKAYLVYAVDAQPPLATLCSRTVQLDDPQAEDDIAQLGAWKKPPALEK